MTTTFFKVKFSHDAISIDSSFWEDGSSLTLNSWVDEGSGCFSYCADSILKAKNALAQRIDQQTSFFNEAKERYEI